METVVNMLALQTCGFEHFRAAVQQAVAHYPTAKVTGLVKPADIELAKASQLFSKVCEIQEEGAVKTACSIDARAFDYCLVPFEDRLGVQYWAYRSIPVRLGIRRIGSYNKYRRFKEAGLTLWVVESLLVNTAVRGAYSCLSLCRRMWWRVRRNVSIAGLFVLAGLALLFRCLVFAGCHPLKWHLANRLPTGRRRLVLHIPSLGLGGAQRQLAIFLEQIDRSQWDVEVVTVDALDKFFEPVIRDLNVSIHHLSPHCQLYEVGLVWQLVRYLYRNPCHVLHSWLHFSVAIGSVAGTLVGIPTIVGSVRSERPSRFPWFFPPWQRAIDIVTAPLQTWVIANSDAVRRESRAWAFLPDRKMITIYNGINFQPINALSSHQRRDLRDQLNLTPEAPVVGIVGRLSPEKDHLTFLQSARLIGRQMPTVMFLIVGDGPSGDTIRRETVALGLQGRVVMTGERRDVLPLMQLMDVLVLTSVSEGLPNVLLEGAAVGVPVVTSTAGGAPEVVLNGKTGFVVPCRDSQAVADRVMEILRDPLLRQRFADAGRERAHAVFSAERFAAGVQGCYSMNNISVNTPQSRVNRPREITRVAVEQPHE